MAYATTVLTAVGGGEEARKRHLGRNKLLPRDRIESILDPGCVVVSAGIDADAQIALFGIVATCRISIVRRRRSRRRHYYRDWSRQWVRGNILGFQVTSESSA
jgi:hypothetical protein